MSMLPGSAARQVPTGVHYGFAGAGRSGSPQLASARRGCSRSRETASGPRWHPGAAPAPGPLREDKRMSAVSPGSPGTPDSGEPPRLPLRWAVITGVTAAAGIACFAAGGIAVAITAAAAVAVTLHELLT